MDEGMAVNLKAMARAKRAASQRGRARSSYHDKQMPRHSPNQTPTAAKNHDNAGNEEEETEEEIPQSQSAVSNLQERLMPKDSTELDAGGGVKSKGWNYAELLQQRAFPLYHDVPGLKEVSSLSLAKDLDSLGWNFEDLYGMHSTDLKADSASYLTLDLKALSESLAQLGTAQRLFLDDEILEMGMISQKSTLRSLEKKIAPSEIIQEVDIDIRGLNLSSEAGERANVSFEGGSIIVREQVDVIPAISTGEGEIGSSSDSEQTALSLMFSHWTNASSNNRSVQSDQPLEVFPSSLKDAEVELDALLHMAGTDDTLALLDRNNKKFPSSQSLEQMIPYSQAFFGPLKHDPKKSNMAAPTDANTPTRSVSKSQKDRIPSLSQPSSSSFKQDSDKGITKPLDDTFLTLRVPYGVSTLLAPSAPEKNDGSSGSALLGSSEDFDAWLDSI